MRLAREVIYDHDGVGIVRLNGTHDRQLGATGASSPTPRPPSPTPS